MIAGVVVVVYDGRNSRVEDGEQPQGRAHAIGAVPECRRSEEMGGKEAEVVGVSKRRQQRGGGSEYSVANCQYAPG